jgi:hypothetical protein
VRIVPLWVTLDRQAVEFGVEIGEYHGVVRVPRRVLQQLLSQRPTPEKCVEPYYLQRTRFESIAEREAAPAPVDQGRERGDLRARFAAGVGANRRRASDIKPHLRRYPIGAAKTAGGEAVVSKSRSRAGDAIRLNLAWLQAKVPSVTSALQEPSIDRCFQ